MGALDGVERPPDVDCRTLDEVVDHYEGYVFKIVVNAGMGEECHEIVQATFLSLGEWIRRKGQMPQKITSFIAVLTWRRIYDCLRRKRIDLKHDSDDVLELSPASRSDPEQDLVAAETAELVRRALADMKPRDRLLLLQHADGMSAEEIADSLGCTGAVARVWLSRAKKRFIALAPAHHLDLGGSE